MEDLKNLVIKVKYPSSESKSAKPAKNSQKTTVWNIKRLLMAFTIIALLLFVILYLLLSSSSEVSNTKDSNPVTDTVKTTAQGTALVKSKPGSKINITRALLTLGLKNNEPAAELIPPLILPAHKTVSVYYFLEVTDMKDRIIFHEWWLGNKLINRKKISISNNDKWRTVSHQLVAYAAKNDWTVKVVDEKGQSIIEKRFDIIDQQ
jgi:Protein of unknown function (DUF2914)